LVASFVAGRDEELSAALTNVDRCLVNIGYVEKQLATLGAVSRMTKVIHLLFLKKKKNCPSLREECE
jgi:hypothetical protein